MAPTNALEESIGALVQGMLSTSLAGLSLLSVMVTIAVVNDTILLLLRG
jgi:hypothetical protein